MGKATISRSNLRHKFFKTGTEESKKGFNRQKNCVSLLCKTIESLENCGSSFFEESFCKESIIFNNNNKIPVIMGN